MAPCQKHWLCGIPGSTPSSGDFPHVWCLLNELTRNLVAACGWVESLRVGCFMASFCCDQGKVVSRHFGCECSANLSWVTSSPLIHWASFQAATVLRGRNSWGTAPGLILPPQMIPCCVFHSLNALKSCALKSTSNTLFYFLLLPDGDTACMAVWDLQALQQCAFPQFQTLFHGHSNGRPPSALRTLKFFLIQTEAFLHYSAHLLPAHCKHFLLPQMYGLCCLIDLPSKLESLDILTLITSAICHDLDHPGYNNAYQVSICLPFLFWSDPHGIESSCLCKEAMTWVLQLQWSFLRMLFLPINSLNAFIPRIFCWETYHLTEKMVSCLQAETFAISLQEMKGDLCLRYPNELSSEWPLTHILQFSNGQPSDLYYDSQSGWIHFVNMPLRIGSWGICMFPLQGHIDRIYCNCSIWTLCIVKAPPMLHKFCQVVACLICVIWINYRKHYPLICEAEAKKQADSQVLLPCLIIGCQGSPLEHCSAIYM